jgi:hypothetical protein
MRSSVRNLACALALAAAPAAAAPPLPPGVSALLPQARVQGGGELTWLGIAVYHGYLWSADGSFAFDEPFALDLHYLRPLAGRAIAQRSVEEITKLGFGEAADHARWGDVLARLFPDVRRGDRLTGLHVPGRGVRFFHNGRLLGEVAEPGFARAFFGIWLDDRTSRPDFRRRLLGQP